MTTNVAAWQLLALVLFLYGAALNAMLVAFQRTARNAHGIAKRANALTGDAITELELAQADVRRLQWALDAADRYNRELCQDIAQLRANGDGWKLGELGR